MLCFISGGVGKSSVNCNYMYMFMWVDLILEINFSGFPIVSTSLFTF